MAASVFAQAPQKMSYQAVIRDASNALIANQTVGIQVSILQGSASGTAVYVETQSAATNTNGLVSIEIGGGTLVSGSFSTINWANGPFFIKTETDPAGGTNYAITGTTELLSVPYALFSSNGIPVGGASGQVLTNCNGIATWTTGGICPGSITSLSCGSASNMGTLTAGTPASGVSSSIPYTGGNGGTYNGQTVTSAGVTGLSATFVAGTFATGSGALTYAITGTPGAAGTASFTLNIGGQTCTLSLPVLPIGSISSLNCGSATSSGTLTAGATTIGVSSSIPYTGGNGGTHSGQIVTSTGVAGLTATLSAGSFATGAGSLNYTISGSPSAVGMASFALNIGGQTCTLNITVVAGSITTLDCVSATNNGTITAGFVTSGVSSTIPYSGGNGGTHSGQTVTSSGITGLTATLPAGNFATGVGSLNYTISGTPSAVGAAIFALNIGGEACNLSIIVNAADSSTATCGATNVHNPNLTYGSMTDQDGNVYKTIVIGTQEWMAENLSATHYNNGVLIPIVNNAVQWSTLSTGAGAWHNNDSINYNCPYGKLYNWYAVNTGLLCPSSWHVPTIADWNVLINNLGGANTAGGKMKTTDMYYWASPNIGGSNLSGFSALPGGNLSYLGTFSPLGGNAVFWSNSVRDINESYVCTLYYGSTDAGIAGANPIKNGLSVRCVKD